MHMRPSTFIISFSLTADFSPVVYIGHNSLTPSSVGTHLGRCHFLVIRNSVARNSAVSVSVEGHREGKQSQKDPCHNFLSSQDPNL